MAEAPPGLQQAPGTVQLQVTMPGTSTEDFYIPNQHVGRVIGKGGETIRLTNHL